jgi:uncharacterized protein YjbI with pentapeptide repeats
VVSTSSFSEPALFTAIHGIIDPWHHHGLESNLTDETLPLGSRYPHVAGTEDAFYFDCRSVPQPIPNLVFIHGNVCNRSGVTWDEEDGEEPNCPVLACPYNVRDKRRLRDNRADYTVLAVANLRPSSKYQPKNDLGGTEGHDILAVKCPHLQLYSFDEEPDPEAPGRFRPLTVCPLCGQPVTERPRPQLGVPFKPREVHLEVPLPFAPPPVVGDDENEEEPDINLGPVCDPAVFHPGADLSGRELSKAKLTNADLSMANLTGSNLEMASLVDANLHGARLAGARLTHADLSEANAPKADLRRATLDEAWGNGIVLEDADLRLASMRDSSFSGGDLHRANLAGADLTGAQLDGADLRKAYLAGAVLSGANLKGANLEDANLVGADLTEAVLTGAILDGVLAAGAVMRKANLENVQANFADFSECDFTGACLTGGRFDRSTFHGARFDRTSAVSCAFDFADFRSARVSDSDFKLCSFRGAALDQAVVQRSDFKFADLTWAETKGWQVLESEMSEVRSAEPEAVSHSPGGEFPEKKVKRPLYRVPATRQERERFLEAMKGVDEPAI